MKDSWAWPVYMFVRYFGTELAIIVVKLKIESRMKTSTFNTGNETEAIALVTFFSECGISASRKGVVVKATGEPNLISHLFDIFIINALV